MAVHPRVKELLEQHYDDQRSDNWYKLRNTMLTASDAATALGDNPFEKPGKLLLKKVVPSLNTFKGNDATAHGQKYEPVARDLYCEQYNEVATEIGLVQHRVHKWLGGSPDGITNSGKLIEIKCPLSRKIKAECPKYYLPQIQVLLDVLDLEECDFIQYRPDPYEFVVVKVKRDREWFAEKLPIMKAFWDQVLWAREHGLSEFREDNGTYSKDDQVQPLPKADTADVRLQGLSEQEPVCELHSVGETFVPQLRRSQRQKDRLARKAASV